MERPFRSPWRKWLRRIALGLALAAGGIALTAGVALFLLIGGESVSDDMPKAPPPDPEIRWSGSIGLCFPEAGPDDSERIAAVRRAAHTWMSESGAEFRFEPACAAPDDRRSVPILFLTDPGAFAAADDLGNRLAEGGEIRLRAEFPMSDAICGDNGSVGPLGCVYAEAVHELGHVLGFSHDHVSVNAPECAGMSVSQEDTDLSMTYYDPDSVMNYCNPGRWLGRLSEADICSVQVAYPRPGDRRRQPEECERIAALGAGAVGRAGAPVKAAR